MQLISKEQFDLFINRFEIIGKSTNVIEYGVVTLDEIQKQVIDGDVPKGDFMMNIVETDTTSANVTYYIAENNSDEPFKFDNELPTYFTRQDTAKHIQAAVDYLNNQNT